MGVRKTISFQEEVYEKVDEDVKKENTNLSNYVNDEFRKKFNVKKIDRRKDRKKMKGGKKR